jgi:hypothetical protein
MEQSGEHEKRIELIFIKIIDDRIKRLEDLRARYQRMLDEKFEDTPMEDSIRIENDFNILFFDEQDDIGEEELDELLAAFHP